MLNWWCIFQNLVYEIQLQSLTSDLVISCEELLSRSQQILADV